MTESQIRDRINTLNEEKMQHLSWLNGRDAEQADKNYVQKVWGYVDKIEKQIDDLNFQLQHFDHKKEHQTPLYNLDEKNTLGRTSSSNNPAIQARYDAQQRLFGMSKFKQTIAKVTGQQRKFKKLWNRASDYLNDNQKQEVASELNKMFR
jgi:hypothetical protein